MPVLPSERMLRRAVAQLQTLPSTDFDAVLDTLDQNQRARVLTLLKGLQGQPASDMHNDGPSPFEAVVLPSDISLWLVARINGSGEGGHETTDPFVMTEHAQMALRRCAAGLVLQPARGAYAPSLVSRLIGLFT
jgi:hypothetical protein